MHIYFFFNDSTGQAGVVFTDEVDPPGDFAPQGFRLNGSMETEDDFDGTPPGDGDFFIKRP